MKSSAVQIMLNYLIKVYSAQCKCNNQSNICSCSWCHGLCLHCFSDKYHPKFSHPSLRCYTLFKQYKKLNCYEKLGYNEYFSHTTHSQMPIKLKQVLLLKRISQLTPWSRVLLVKLTLPQLAKKFPAF